MKELTFWHQVKALQERIRMIIEMDEVYAGTLVEMFIEGNLEKI